MKSVLLLSMLASVAVSAVCLAAPTTYGTWGLDLTARSPGVDPGDDFFEYANGSWLAKTEIPADQSSVSAGTRRLQHDSGPTAHPD
jgi:predicted metalloendopeptidase